MGQFVVGDIVAVPFPFSDLSSTKIRPALVLAEADFDNLILCQLTSNRYGGTQTITIDERDFSEGNLPLKSYARPDKLFTAEQTIIRKKRGTLKTERTNAVLAAVRQQFPDLYSDGRGSSSQI